MDRKRMLQLGGFRALAVALVLYQHTMRPAGPFTRDAGAIGVVFFFVLSGFLITGILLDARAAADAEGASAGVLGRFYLRRFLRIFPLYYAVLIVAFVAGDPDVHANIGWLATYTTNFRMADLGRNIGLPTPFWSLAIEEQFYLLWPCVVLFVSPKHLRSLLLGMVFVSVLSRLLIALTGAPEHTITMPTWSALDGLAVGGLLVLAFRSGKDYTVAIRWVLGIGMALLAIRLGFVAMDRFRPVRYALWMLPWALVAAWLVDLAARDRLPSIFRSRALGWIGLISYGIYAYHRPIMSVLGIGDRRGWDVLVLVTAVTLAVASASWILFERPINDLKRFWPLSTRAAECDGSVSHGDGKGFGQAVGAAQG